MNGKNDDWSPCPRGELEKMVQTARAGRQQQMLAKTATVLVFVLVFGVGIGTVARLRNGRSSIELPPTTNVSCSDFDRLISDYESKTLSAEMMRSVSDHLKCCPHCAEKLRQARNKGGENSRCESRKKVIALSH